MSPHLILIIVSTLVCLIMILLFAIKRVERKLQNQPQLLTTPTKNVLKEDQISSIIETVTRFRFFQEDNLKHFEQLLFRHQLADAQLMIAQKFRAQQKHQPDKLAQEVFAKLLETAKE